MIHKLSRWKDHRFDMHRARKLIRLCSRGEMFGHDRKSGKTVDRRELLFALCCKIDSSGKVKVNPVEIGSSNEIILRLVNADRGLVLTAGLPRTSRLHLPKFTRKAA